jgi:hypothetical protein
MEFGASIFFTDYSITPAELAVAMEERGFEPPSIRTSRCRAAPEPTPSSASAITTLWIPS